MIEEGDEGRSLNKTQKKNINVILAKQESKKKIWKVESCKSTNIIIYFKQINQSLVLEV